MKSIFNSSFYGLLVLILINTLHAQNPDALYPIPSNLGEPGPGEVNLFSGTLQKEISLFNLKGFEVDYHLKASYNSASAQVIKQDASQYEANVMGGYGWKMMDYPKIVQDGGGYYLLDGKRSYLLEDLGAGIFTTGNDKYLWRIYFGTGGWHVADGYGTHYHFRQGAIAIDGLAIWNFTSIRNYQATDSISFNYGESGKLYWASNTSGDTVKFSYGGGPTPTKPHLTEIQHSKNGNLISSQKYSYQSYALWGESYALLAETSNIHKISAAYSAEREASLKFSYAKTSSTPVAGSDLYPGALQSVTTPAGSITTYAYKKQTVGSATAYSVIQYAVNDGYSDGTGGGADNLTYHSLLYETDNALAATNGVYLHFNKVAYAPGGQINSTIAETQYPYGTIENYFLNGQTAAQLKALPSSYPQTNISNSILLGLNYQKIINHATTVSKPDEETVQILNFWDLGYITASKGGFPKLLKTFDKRHDIGKWTTYTYGTAYQLPKVVSTVRRNPEPTSTALNKDSLVSRVVYAFEQYSDLTLEQTYLIHRVAQRKEFVQDDLNGPFEITHCDCSQWAQWSKSGSISADGYWSPSKYIRMRNGAASADQCFTANVTSSDWLIMGAVNLRSSLGRTIDSTTISGTHVSHLPSVKEKGAFALASFKQANVFDAGKRKANADYLGFESYERDFTKTWKVAKQRLNTDYAHTGKRSFSGTMSRSFTVSDQGDYYVVNAWIGMHASGDEYDLQLKDASGSVLGSAKGNWITGAPSVQFVEFSAYLPAGYPFTVSVETDGNAFIDDIIIAPAQSQFQASVFDIDRNLHTAELGQNGSTTHLVYNRLNSLLAQVGPGSAQNINYLNIPYNSRKGNLFFEGTDAFNKTHPNSIISASARSGGYWQGFEYNSSKGFPNANLNGMVVNNDRLEVETVPASATFQPSIDAENWAVYTELFPNAITTSQEMGISFQLDSLGLEGKLVESKRLKLVITGDQLKLYSGAILYDSYPIANMTKHASLTVSITGENYLYAYLNGRYVFEHEFDLAKLKSPLKLITNNPGAAFDNFILLTDPTVSLTTYDGRLQQKQKLSQQDDGSMKIKETLYGGALNMPLAQSRSALIGGEDGDKNGLSYKPDFAKGFDASTMSLSADSRLVEASNYDDPFDASIDYDKSPLLQVEEFGAGGDFTAGEKDAHYSTFTYESNEGHIYPYFPDALLVRVKTDANAVKNYRYTNREGVLFATARVDGADTLRTQYEYDNHLRLYKTYLPNYYNKSLAGYGKFVNTREYDFVGNLIQTSNADEGTAKYVYDPSGRLRFEMDAGGAASTPNKIGYYVYDKLGRVIESGTLNLNWDRTVLQSKADTDPFYPYLTNSGWKARYTYDAKGLDNDKGRLVSSETNSDGNSHAEVQETFQYDEYGNVVDRALYSKAFGDRSYQVQYTYDLENRITSIQFPDMEHPGVTYTYNGEKQITGVGVPGDEDYYASYDYGYETVEYLNKGQSMRKYYFNEVGWPTEINDVVFNETLSYEDKLAGGSKYDYDGKIASLQDVKKWTLDTIEAKFTYNNDARLTSANYGPGHVWNLGENTPVTYDKNGNLQALQYGSKPATSFSYQTGSNQIHTYGGWNFEHTSNGAITSISTRMSGLTYDPLTHLTLTANHKGNRASYQYNGENKRVFKQVQYASGKQSQRLYVHGMSDYPLMEVYRDTLGAIHRGFYVYGPKGLISVQVGKERLFAVKDHLGSVRAWIDTTNEVRASFDYSAFGNIVERAEDKSLGVLLSFLNYKYTGQEEELELGGVYNYRARIYDPAIGRFYSPDPKMQYPSPYEYVGNNPINYMDLSGEWGWFSTIITAVVAVAVTTAVIVTAPVSGPILLVAAVAAGTVAGTIVGTTSGVLHDGDGVGESFVKALGVSATASLLVAGVAGGAGAGVRGAAGMLGRRSVTKAVLSAVAITGFAEQGVLHKVAVERHHNPKLPMRQPTLEPVTTTPIDALDDGIGEPIQITQIGGAVGVLGHYSIIDLSKAQPVVPSGIESEKLKCFKAIGCYKGGKAPGHRLYPFRYLKNNEGLNPSQGVYYLGFNEVYETVLSTNANFWNTKYMPHKNKCTHIFGLSVGDGVFVSDAKDMASWKGKGLSQPLDALVFYKEGIQKNGKVVYAEMIVNDKLPLEPFGDDPAKKQLKGEIKNAVSGIYYVRNGAKIDLNPSVIKSTSRVARTLIGLNSDGTKLCVLQVGKGSAKNGINLDDAIKWFSDQNFTEVIALDGSGSSALLYEKNGTTVQSKPSDTSNPCRSGAGLFYRPSPNFLGFKAR